MFGLPVNFMAKITKRSVDGYLLAVEKSINQQQTSRLVYFDQVK